MALKIAINGEKKSIAGRSSRPVVFINGEKKRLVKGITFINGEKKYLWGTENKIDVFLMPNDIYRNYAPVPVYIDDKKLAVTGSTTNTTDSSSNFTIFDISNFSSPYVDSDYAWGSAKVYSQFNENEIRFCLNNGNTFNEILYKPKENTSVVVRAFTSTVSSSTTGSGFGKSAVDGNGDWYSTFAIPVWSGNKVVYRNYYLYKNNTKIQDLGTTNINIRQVANGVVLATKDKSLYEISSSGIGNPVYTVENGTIADVLFDGEYIFVLSTYGEYKILSTSYTEIGYGVFNVNSGDNFNIVGRGADGLFYVVYSYREWINASTRVYMCAISAISTDGQIVETYPFNNYNGNGDLIKSWNTECFVGSSNYLALTASSISNYEMYVARIFVG